MTRRLNESVRQRKSCVRRRLEVNKWPVANAPLLYFIKCAFFVFIKIIQMEEALHHHSFSIKNNTQSQANKIERKKNYLYINGRENASQQQLKDRQIQRIERKKIPFVFE